MTDGNEKTLTNVHPVDEIGEIRKTMAGLEAREAELRAIVLEGVCSMKGEEYSATVKNFDGSRFDASGYRKHVGDEVLKDWIIRQKKTSLYVRKI